MKQYKSFKEIDRDLKVLKLQNQIDKEEVKLSVARTKEGLSPGYLLKSTATAAVKRAIILKGTVQVLGKKYIKSMISSI